MTVYHGSNVAVENPRLIMPNRALDFGNGFYTTMNLEQAVRFAYNVVNRNEGRGVPTISHFEIDYNKLLREFSVLQFKRPNEKWLDFVYANRTLKYTGKQYDVVIGPVANDTVYRVFRLYENGDIDRAATIKRLKVSKLFNQMAFCTEKSINELSYIGSEVLSSDNVEYTGFLALHSHPIIESLAQIMDIPIRDALDIYYKSAFYKVYERESTKLWHFSNVTLTDIVHREVTTGRLEFPVEG